MKVVKTFEIEYDAELGRDWLCNGNLVLVLTSQDYVEHGLIERVEEVGHREINEGVQRWNSPAVKGS